MVSHKRLPRKSRGQGAYSRERGAVRRLNELPNTNRAVYPATACPAWDSSVLVDVGTACSAEEFAHVYLRVPSEAGRAIWMNWFHAVRDASSQVTLNDRSTSSTNTRTSATAERRAVSKAPGALVIGVPSRTWGSFMSTVLHAPRRPDRRPSSLCGEVENATSRRQSWGTTLRKIPIPAG